jgi:hypothetical protein
MRALGAAVLLLTFKFIAASATSQALAGMEPQLGLRRASSLAVFLASAQGRVQHTLTPLSITSPAGLAGELTLRLRGGKKGTASMGKRGTGAKSHPGYKYSMSYPRISRHQTSKRKRYCIKKNPERSGRCKHLRLVQRRFKHGFRTNPPYAGPKDTPASQGEA